MKKAVALSTCLLLMSSAMQEICAQGAPAGYPQAYGQGGYSPGPHVITVMQQRMGATVVLGGTVVPYREVTLSAQVPGRVEMLGGREGDEFGPGSLLALIDDDDLQAKRRAVVANVDNSALALRNAQMQYGREWWSPKSRDINKMPGMGMPSLFDQFFTRNVGSGMGYGNPWLERQVDLYASGTQYGQARGSHIAALSQLEEVEARLRDTRTVAPFKGVISARIAETGDTVQPGQPLLKYADINDLQLEVEVPSRLLHGLRKEMVVPAMLDVGNRYVNAKVAQIFPVGNMRRHTITVKFDLPIGVNALPGTYAEVMVPDTDANVGSVAVIPPSAVVNRGSLNAVFTMSDQGQPKLRLIRLGESLGPNQVAVLAGLQVGERVIANPAPGMSTNSGEAPIQ